MSKRKKSYNRMREENPYYVEKMMEPSNAQYFNPYYNMQMNNMNNQMYDNNFKNGFNYGNIMELLSTIDFKNLNNIMSFMSDGFDINNFNLGNFNSNNINNTYNHEIIISFFNSLKPILGIDYSNIADKFIQFYMDEINGEK